MGSGVRMGYNEQGRDIMGFEAGMGHNDQGKG